MNIKDYDDNDNIDDYDCDKDMIRIWYECMINSV